MNNLSNFQETLNELLSDWQAKFDFTAPIQLNGRPARLLGVLDSSEYPLVVAFKKDDNDYEETARVDYSGVSTLGLKFTNVKTSPLRIHETLNVSITPYMEVPIGTSPHHVHPSKTCTELSCDWWILHPDSEDDKCTLQWTSAYLYNASSGQVFFLNFTKKV